MQDRRIRGRKAASAAVETAYFEREHRRLHAELHAHLLDVVAGNFSRALVRLDRWRRALATHIDIEETRLLPHVPEDARWAAHVYRLEHQMILQLADAYMARVGAVAPKPPDDSITRRAAALALLDAVHALRHVLEHHHQREEMALAHELSRALQDATWDPRNLMDPGNA